MRILCVCQYFWPESFRVNDMCLGLKAEGHDVTVRVPLIPRFRSTAAQLLLNYLSFMILASCRALTFIGQKKKYDVILVYQLSPVTMAIPAILLKKMLGLPLVLYVLDLWPDNLRANRATNNSRVIKLFSFISMFIYRQCDSILASSRGFIDQLAARGIKPERLMYFPQWADGGLSGDAKVKEAFAFKPDAFHIVFTGNIGDSQDFDTIINAAELVSEHRKIHWVIIGDGRKRSWLAEQVAERRLEENFHLLGRKPIESMPFYYEKADALLVSLVDDAVVSLTLPAKVQSYLVSGKPIIAALRGEGAAIIKEAGAGISCCPGDPKALADAILQLYNLSAEARRTMGEKGRVYAREYFSRRKLLDQLQGVLHKVVLAR
ncbi:MAG: glycosyltransferase [Firmicutes bacterium]|nr:glycosyltransferase [Bacillota bacterium]